MAKSLKKWENWATADCFAFTSSQITIAISLAPSAMWLGRVSFHTMNEASVSFIGALAFRLSLWASCFSLILIQ